MSGPDFSFEDAISVSPLCGIDEAGRGPWAGPVVAAAVILDRDAVPEGLNDSKKLSAKRREVLFSDLQSCALIGIGIASVSEIDRLNISKANWLAMGRAFELLPVRPQFALIDGNRIPPELPCSAKAIVKGDGRSLSIAAASIAAKVTRDRIMAELSREYPEYGWDRNAGYGVPAHSAALARLGVTPHHRRSFAPIHKMLCEDN